MRLEDGLARLSTEEKEKFALMCALLGHGTREVELSVQNLEEALVARYGESGDADVPRSVVRLWWYGLVRASGPLRAAPHKDAARAASLLFLGHLNAHAGAGGWRVLSENLELAWLELSHAGLTEAGERALAESDLAPLERALLSALENKRRVPVLELGDGEDDPVATLLTLRRLEAQGHIELSGDAFVALGLAL